MATISNPRAGVSPFQVAPAALPTMLRTSGSQRASEALSSTVSAASTANATTIVNGQEALNQLINTSRNGVFQGANVTINLEEQQFSTTNQVTSTTNYPSGTNGAVQFSNGANSFASDVDFTYSDSNLFTPGIRTDGYFYSNGAPFVAGGNASTGNFVFTGDTMSIGDLGNTMFITAPSAIGGVTGSNIQITAGYTTGVSDLPAGNLILQAGNTDGNSTGGSVFINAGVKAGGTSNGNITLNSGSDSIWFFENSGNTTFPTGMHIDNEGANTRISQNAGFLKMTAGGNASLIIGWTADETIQAPVAQIVTNGATTPNAGNLFVKTGNTAANVFIWNFEQDGNLNLPGSLNSVNGLTIQEPPTVIIFSGADHAPCNGTYTRGPNSGPNNQNQFWHKNGNIASDQYIGYIQINGSSQPVLEWQAYAADVNPDIPIYINTGSLYQPLAQWDSGYGSVPPTGTYTLTQWTFDITGNLILPEGTPSINYANGDPYGGSGTGTGNYTFSGNVVEMPLTAQLNSGGIGFPNSAEFGTEVTNILPSGSITGSQIYMSAGTGEGRIIVNSDGNALTYYGVENPGFAGTVAMDPGVTSEYAIQVGTNNQIEIGAVVGPITTTEYVTGLGVLNATANITGLFANANVAVIGAGNTGWAFSTDGSLQVPSNSLTQIPGTIASANGYPTLVAFGSGGFMGIHGGPELDWMNADDPANTFGNVNTLRNTAYLNGSGFYIGMNENSVVGNTIASWRFTPDGDLTLPSGGQLGYAGMGWTGLKSANGTPIEIDSYYANGNISSQIFLTSDGSLSIVGFVDGGASSSWTFNADGNLTVPGPITGYTGGEDQIGGNVLITGGTGSDGNYPGLHGGGDANIQGGTGRVNAPGGNVNLVGGISANGLADYGRVNITSGASTWVFNNDGNLTTPGTSGNITGADVITANVFAMTQGGNITEGTIPAYTSLTGNTIVLTPSGGTSADQQLVVYPTGNIVEGNHLHLTSGNLYNTELFLGDDFLYVKLANTGNIVINSNDNVGNSAQWTFDTAGNVIFPTGNLVIISDYAAFGNAAVISSADHNLITLSTGANGGISSLWVEDYANIGSSNIAAVYANPVPGSGNVRIAVGTNGGGGPNLWDFQPNGNLTAPGNISTTGNITGAYFFGNGSQLTDVGAASVPSQTILPTIQTITAIPMLTGYLSGGQGGVTVTVANTIPVTEYGVIVTAGTVSQKYATGALGSIPGTGNITFTTGLSSPATFTVYAYVTSNAGTYYSNAVTGTSGLCLLAGTQIALSDGTHKAIEDITYTDKLLSWDFDRGCYAETSALWIKRSETGSQYNLLTFSDGTTLRTFDQHRIFNKQAGAFTYPMTEATPVGTITVNEHGQEITLTNKQVIQDTIEYYNVITNYHMNLFSDSVLTSCRFNNIYPIVDMKFVKDSRTLRTRAEFENVEDRFFHGLRLAEQTADIETVEWYVNRLLSTEVSTQSELAF